MKKILIFTGSNSSKSINRKLAGYVKSRVNTHEVTEIDLRDYPLPIYGMDMEESEGIPENAHQLKAVFNAHDGFIIVLPEHNSSVPAFLKNTIDWLSRIETGLFASKPLILFGTSPGPGAAKSALAHFEKIVSGYLAGQFLGAFGLPKYFKSIAENADGSISVADEAAVKSIDALVGELEKMLS